MRHQNHLVYTVQCIDCSYVFDDFEDEFGLCPECGKQQPESGSWATEEMARIETLEKESSFAEAVAEAMDLLYMATDVEYGDWPFAHRLAETIRRLCDEGGLVEESEEHELHWKLIEANQMGGTQERTEAYERWRKSRQSRIQGD